MAHRAMWGIPSCGLLALSLVVVPSAWAQTAYRATPGPYRATVKFSLSYTGSAKYATTYHAVPPNQGGNPDDNNAHDSSSWRWSLSFARITLPQCTRPQTFRSDPCRRVRGVLTASGQESAAGNIRHSHIDGLYKDLNRSISCHVSWSSVRGQQLQATISVRYSAKTRTWQVTALTPVENAIESLPSACPEQGDAIDGLYDNYFTPGFSFARGYGPDRWFAAATVSIPPRVVHNSSRITIPLSLRRAGVSPANCAVAHPSYERCRTGGSWSGTLVLTAKR